MFLAGRVVDPAGGTCDEGELRDTLAQGVTPVGAKIVEVWQDGRVA